MPAVNAAAHESVAAIIRARAAVDPGAIAITGDGRPLTFGELDERSSRLASALAVLGVHRGDRVAEWVEALPRNPSGKVLRRTLREPYWKHLDRQVG